VVVCALGVGGCEAAAPFDEWPLREALGADPQAIAALPDDARRRLAARFEDARVRPEPPSTHAADATRAADATHASDATRAGDATRASDATSAAELVRALDGARAAERRDALIVGALGASPHALHVAPLADSELDAEPLELPASAFATRELERRALATRAAPIVRALARASGATRFERVVGWPAAAVAVGDTVYVNAAWLVALSALDDADGGAPFPVERAPIRAAATRVQAPRVSSGASLLPPGARESAGDTPGGTIDLGASGGAPAPAPAPDPSSPRTCDDGCNDGCGEACATSAATGEGCASSSSSDSCGSSSSDNSSCDSNSSDSSCDSNSCDSSGSDCNCSGAARAERSCPRRRGREAATLLWLLLPLAYLLAAGRRA